MPPKKSGAVRQQRRKLTPEFKAKLPWRHCGKTQRRRSWWHTLAGAPTRLETVKEGTPGARHARLWRGSDAGHWREPSAAKAHAKHWRAGACDDETSTAQQCSRHHLLRTGLQAHHSDPPQADPKECELAARTVEIAHACRRFGDWRIHALLRPQFPGVNHKRIWHLYSAANLAVRKRKKVRRPRSERVPLQAASTVGEVWSMDFVSDSLASGRRLKRLTVADDFSHECVDIAVDYGISGEYVTRLLDRAAVFRGYPEAVRTDNGPEFTSRAFIAWVQQHHIRHLLIESGKPMQNGYIESFNGKFRDECVNEHWFQTLQQARQEVARSRRDYNEVRPHSSIGRIPPAQFAEQHRRHAGGAAHPPSTTKKIT